MWLYIKDGGSFKYSIVESFCSLTSVDKKRGWGYTVVLTTQIMNGEIRRENPRGNTEVKWGCASEIQAIAKAEEIAGTHRKDSE